MLNFELDTIDEKQEATAARIAYYKQQATKNYNKHVRTRNFQVGDWVLRKVFQNTKEAGAGKLGLNWEGPYEVTRIMGKGAYKLQTLDGTGINNSWNTIHLPIHLRKYHV